MSLRRLALRAGPPALSWQEQVMASATVKQKPFIALMWATDAGQIERGRDRAPCPWRH